MAYKFQDGAAALSGNITLNGPFDLLFGTDSQSDIGSDAGNRPAGVYADLIDAPTIGVAGETTVYGDGSNLTGITTDSVDVTGSTSSDKSALVMTGDLSTSGVGLGSATSDGSNNIANALLTFTPSTGLLSGSGQISGQNLVIQDGSTIGPASVTDIMTFAADGDITIEDGAYDFNIASHDGTNGLKLGGVLVNASAADLNFTNVATAGTAEASKAVVLDASKNIATIGTVGCGAITSTGASSFGSISGVGAVTSTGLASLDGGINVNDDFTVNTDGAVVAVGINAGGALSGVTTLAASGLASVASISMDDGSTLGPDSVADLVTFSADGDITIKDGAYDFNIAAHDGTNGLALGGTIVGASANEINFLQGVTAGTAATNAAVVLDGSKNIATIGTVGCGAITSTGASSFGATISAGTVSVSGSLQMAEGIRYTGIQVLVGAAETLTLTSSYVVCNGPAKQTLTLPSTAHNGDWYAIKRSAGMGAYDVNITGANNNHLIDESGDAIVLETAGAAIQLIFDSTTNNWNVF